VDGAGAGVFFHLIPIITENGGASIDIAPPLRIFAFFASEPVFRA
jgi:hypothetical protein